MIVILLVHLTPLGLYTPGGNKIRVQKETSGRKAVETLSCCGMGKDYAKNYEISEM